MLDSSSFRNTGETKVIRYGIGSSEGPICLDTIRFANHESIKADDFKFFIQTDYYGDTYDYDQLEWMGIMGLAPRDESAGPLIMEYLYD